MENLSKEKLEEILVNKNTEIIDFNNDNEWHSLREKGIGGSDIGAILGVNKYRSAIDVYLDKVENIKPDLKDNNAVRWGTLLEPLIRSNFEEINIKRYNVYLTPFLLKFGVLQANLDGIIYDKDSKKYGVLEIKTANQFTVKEWSEGRVPLSYQAQVTHYLAVTGFDYAIIAVLIGGNNYKEFYIERNSTDIDLVVSSAYDFWKNHIETKKIPSPDGSDSYSEYQKELLNKYEAFKERLVISFDKEKMLEKLQDLKLEIKGLEKKAKEIEQKFMNELIESQSNLMVGDKFKVKLVVQNRSKIRPEFKKECKDLIEQYKQFEEKYKETYKINFLKVERIGE